MIDSNDEDRKFVEKEFKRMGFDKDSTWRISDMNKDFELCNTYPRFLILPFDFKDEDIESVAKFRYFRRIPTAVWRHAKNGCFIVRSSQPTVGWFGWFRNEMDENLVQSYCGDSSDDSSKYDGNRNTKNNHNQNHNDSSVDNYVTDDKIAIKVDTNEVDCKTYNGNGNFDSTLADELARSASITELKHSITSSSSPVKLNGNGTASLTLDDLDSSEQVTKPTNISDNSTHTSVTTNDSVTAEPTTPTMSSSRMLIIDARSYAAAMANRAKGGGCECSEYYQKCEVHFMNLANIHSIRKSYQAIRSVCEAYSEQSNNWVSFLDNSRWLHHISGLIKSSLLVVDAIDIEEKSIMIHCSDGWDRTPQLVALAEIMLDPHYRTFEGFKVLIQREWLDFGHKFADRCGSNPCNEDPNERCPVFLQWLDCVQQLLVQYPKHFEFNSAYLDKLNRHTYSNIFGTFSYNSAQERLLSKVDEKLLSLWAYFDSSRSKYRNENYVESEDILRPSYKVKDLHFWKEVYLPPINQPKSTNAHLIPMTNNIDNNKCSQDSLFIDGPANRTVCK